jgi:hypothetical protein
VNLTNDNQQNQQLLATAAVRDALVAVSAHATSADACEWWCNAICYLTDSNFLTSNQQLLRVSAIRSALQSLEQVAALSEAAKDWWGNASTALRS